MIDLHIHSTASDGTLTPQEIVQLASKLNFKAVAITDHDSVNGVEPALRAGKKVGVEVIPAVELSSDLDGQDIHFLGYFINYKNRWLEEYLKKLREARYERAAKMVEKLRERGFDILLKDVLEEAKDGAVGRSHVAKAMVKKRQIDNIKEVFDKFIGRTSPCYVEKYICTPKDIIETIKRIGGIAVLAHPGASDVDEYIEEFVKFGLRGIEVGHRDHKEAQTKYYRELADAYKLVATGGSDCHGVGSRGLIIGSVKIPDSVLDSLREIKKEIEREKLS